MSGKEDERGIMNPGHFFHRRVRRSGILVLFADGTGWNGQSRNRKEKGTRERSRGVSRHTTTPDGIAEQVSITPQQ